MSFDHGSLSLSNSIKTGRVGAGVPVLAADAGEREALDALTAADDVVSVQAGLGRLRWRPAGGGDVGAVLDAIPAHHALSLNWWLQPGVGTTTMTTTTTTTTAAATVATTATTAAATAAVATTTTMTTTTTTTGAAPALNAAGVGVVTADAGVGGMAGAAVTADGPRIRSIDGVDVWSAPHHEIMGR